MFNHIQQIFPLRVKSSETRSSRIQIHSRDNFGYQIHRICLLIKNVVKSVSSLSLKYKGENGLTN
jgi:hypothetical protein